MASAVSPIQQSTAGQPPATPRKHLLETSITVTSTYKKRRQRGKFAPIWSVDDGFWPAGPSLETSKAREIHTDLERW